MAFIPLQTKDGEYFEVDVEIARCSKMMEAMCDQPGTSRDTEPEVVRLDVDGDTMRKVLQWCQHHCYDVPRVEGTGGGGGGSNQSTHSLHDTTTQWDAEFIDVDRKTLFEIIRAAHILKIEPLMRIAVSKMKQTALSQGGS